MAYDFDTIARDYDRMNRLMTLGLDRWWRRYGTQAAIQLYFRKQADDGTQAASLRNIHEQAACVPDDISNQADDGTQAASLRHFRKQAACVPGEYKVLDVACGTGDMVVELLSRGCTVTGVDLSEEMLTIAKRKTAGWQPAYQVADAEHLPFDDESFDAVTCAFGVRNFVHLEQGLKEMLRVLKPSGRMVILELATPDSPVVRPFYNLYTRHVIPWLGQHLAGSREAYTYLPKSIERFPKGKAFLEIINHSPFLIPHAEERKLTFGVCRMYTIEKQRGR